MRALERFQLSSVLLPRKLYVSRIALDPAARNNIIPIAYQRKWGIMKGLDIHTTKIKWLPLNYILIGNRWVGSQGQCLLPLSVRHQSLSNNHRKLNFKSTVYQGREFCPKNVCYELLPDLLWSLICNVYMSIMMTCQSVQDFQSFYCRWKWNIILKRQVLKRGFVLATLILALSKY